ncbi:9223_t:CDS:2 [Cetraspora pellucida]|uniref:9223_t:CDS:1 n=1 Tax=Cetraspora pellucida TaxID=1433469 RepID=A0ACA9L4I0_9GLOM|nr:9223_t:CDS:2 [Cetraspora pellucida]
MTCNNPISSNKFENNVNFEDKKNNEIIVDNKITIDKLIELHPAIRQLLVTLLLENNLDAQKDDQKLNSLMLQDKIESC